MFTYVHKILVATQTMCCQSPETLTIALVPKGSKESLRRKKRRRWYFFIEHSFQVPASQFKAARLGKPTWCETAILIISNPTAANVVDICTDMNKPKIVWDNEFDVIGWWKNNLWEWCGGSSAILVFVFSFLSFARPSQVMTTIQDTGQTSKLLGKLPTAKLYKLVF